MRKSKITSLFDWKKFDEKAAALVKDPKDKSAIKAMKESDKELNNLLSAVTKDLKVGLAQLRGEVAKGAKTATMPYFLHLDYFAKSKTGGSLLIFGSSAALKKAFKAAIKTEEKPNISFGTVQLDSNETLQFIPDTNGMKVKAKPVVTALKKAPIVKSAPGFWAKRKVTNVIIGNLTSADNTIIGDETKIEENVSYSQDGVRSEVFSQFKSFVNRDYAHSNGTRNAEYFAAVLNKTDKWLLNLQKEFTAKGDKKLKKAYLTMGKQVKEFKKRVAEDIKTQGEKGLNQDSSLKSLRNAFNIELEDFKKSNKTFTGSVYEAKLNRILMELNQKINGDASQINAIKLQKILKNKLVEAKRADKTKDPLEEAQKVTPELRQEIDTILAKMDGILKEIDALAPVS